MTKRKDFQISCNN